MNTFQKDLSRYLVADVYIISGFLGAGKTTLLNQLLAFKRNQRNIVIENEFGKESIDKSLISKQLTQSVFEINQGCICCSLDQELYEVLNQIYRIEPPIENVFIEATGIADAGALAASFIDENIEKHFKLRSLICVVDALNIEERLDQEPEVCRQIVAADHIYISKTETEADIERVGSLVRPLNPFAALGNIVSEDLFSNRISYRTFESSTEKRTHKIASVLYETPQTFDRKELSYRIIVTLQLYYDQVYRIKGIVKLAEEEGWFVVQSTGKVFTIEKTEGEFENSKLVFIGKELKTSVVTKILKSALR